MPILTIFGCQKITLVLDAPELRAGFFSFVNRVVQRDIITFLVSLISLGAWIILGFDFWSVDHTGILSLPICSYRSLDYCFQIEHFPAVYVPTFWIYRKKHLENSNE